MCFVVFVVFVDVVDLVAFALTAFEASDGLFGPRVVSLVLWIGDGEHTISSKTSGEEGFSFVTLVRLGRMVRFRRFARRGGEG